MIVPNRRWLATSLHPLARVARSLRRWRGLTIALPPVAFVPYRFLFESIRSVVYQVRRVLIAEPIFRSYCTKVGKGFRTGVFVHWVQGRGHIVIGDNVYIDGKCSFSFASRFADRPTLTIGDRTGIGHGCNFVVAKALTIGNDCRIAGGVTIRESPGHPVDAELRRQGAPPPADSVQPVTIGDNVWIGTDATIQPGVTIGAGSVISSGAVVLSSAPAYSLLAGNPARRIGTTNSTLSISA